MKKAVAFFIVIILAVGAFAGCGNDDTDKKSKPVSKSYEEVLDNFICLLTGKELNRNQVKTLQPEDYFSYMEKQGTDFSEYYTQVQKQIKTNANALTTFFGKDYTASYKVTEDSKLNDEEQYQATKHLNSVPWYDAGDLKETRKLAVEISIKGEKNSQTYEAEIRVMKIGNGWYVLGYQCDELESILS